MKKKVAGLVSILPINTAAEELVTTPTQSKINTTVCQHAGSQKHLQLFLLWRQQPLVDTGDIGFASAHMRSKIGTTIYMVLAGSTTVVNV